MKKIELHRMYHLMGNLRPDSDEEKIRKIVNENTHLKNTSITDLGELYDLFHLSGLSKDEFMKLWWQKHIEREKSRRVYRQTPIRVRQDNKTTINYGTGNSNRNRIRYPKKCRKTAWKRFYKLFPHLKPNDNENN
jgi:hypothetical protein